MTLDKEHDREKSDIEERGHEERGHMSLQERRGQHRKGSVKGEEVAKELKVSVEKHAMSVEDSTPSNTPITGSLLSTPKHDDGLDNSPRSRKSEPSGSSGSGWQTRSSPSVLIGFLSTVTDVHAKILARDHAFFVEMDAVVQMAIASTKIYWSLSRGATADYDPHNYPPPPDAVHIPLPSVPCPLINIVPVEVVSRIIHHLPHWDRLALRATHTSFASLLTSLTHDAICLCIPDYAGDDYDECDIDLHAKNIEFAVVAFIKKYNLKSVVHTIIFNNWRHRTHPLWFTGILNSVRTVVYRSTDNRFPVIPAAHILPCTVQHLELERVSLKYQPLYFLLGPSPSITVLRMIDCRRGYLRPLNSTLNQFRVQQWFVVHGFHDRGLYASEADLWTSSRRSTLLDAIISFPRQSIDATLSIPPANIEHFVNDLCGLSEDDVLLDNLMPSARRFPHRLSLGVLQSLSLAMSGEQLMYLPLLLAQCKDTLLHLDVTVHGTVYPGVDLRNYIPALRRLETLNIRGQYAVIRTLIALLAGYASSHSVALNLGLCLDHGFARYLSLAPGPFEIVDSFSTIWHPSSLNLSMPLQHSIVVHGCHECLPGAASVAGTCEICTTAVAVIVDALNYSLHLYLALYIHTLHEFTASFVRSLGTPSHITLRVSKEDIAKEQEKPVATWEKAYSSRSPIASATSPDTFKWDGQDYISLLWEEMALTPGIHFRFRDIVKDLSTSSFPLHTYVFFYYLPRRRMPRTPESSFPASTLCLSLSLSAVCEASPTPTLTPATRRFDLDMTNTLTGDDLRYLAKFLVAFPPDGPPADVIVKSGDDVSYRMLLRQLEDASLPSGFIPSRAPTPSPLRKSPFHPPRKSTAIPTRRSHGALLVSSPWLGVHTGRDDTFHIQQYLQRAQQALTYFVLRERLLDVVSKVRFTSLYGGLPRASAFLGLFTRLTHVDLHGSRNDYTQVMTIPESFMLPSTLLFLSIHHCVFLGTASLYTILAPETTLQAVDLRGLRNGHLALPDVHDTSLVLSWCSLLGFATMGAPEARRWHVTSSPTLENLELDMTSDVDDVVFLEADIGWRCNWGKILDMICPSRVDLAMLGAIMPAGTAFPFRLSCTRVTALKVSLLPFQAYLLRDILDECRHSLTILKVKWPFGVPHMSQALFPPLPHVVTLEVHGSLFSCLAMLPNVPLTVRAMSTFFITNSGHAIHREGPHPAYRPIKTAFESSNFNGVVHMTVLMPFPCNLCLSKCDSVVEKLNRKCPHYEF
ncbi:hypothetical protein BDZ89DRAFT_1043403 [Hymenopellis radicata]|nr:hypothetical protein BDZ89DRAFT_1043403 [Hymenopellis radicata]